MPNRVYNNVEGHRLFDGKDVVEDVTSVTLPDLEHPTTSIAVAGMAADVDMPNSTHLNAMSYSISHNNGIGGNLLASPGKHSHEFRVVRQRYNVKLGEIEHESVKFRLVGVLKKTGKGNIETNNPYGNTNDYALLRYEEEIDGKVVTLVDVMAGIINVNGVSHTDVIENMLA